MQSRLQIIRALDQIFTIQQIEDTNLVETETKKITFIVFFFVEGNCHLKLKNQILNFEKHFAVWDLNTPRKVGKKQEQLLQENGAMRE